MAAKGIEARWAKITGPLPGRLTIDGLVLADAEGEFAKAERLDFSLVVGSLWSGLVEVRNLSVEGLDFARRPVLPPSESSSGGGPPLIDVLAKFHVDGRISPQTLSPEAVGRGAGRLNVDGDLKFSGGALDASLTVVWLDENEQGLQARISLSQSGSGSPDALLLDVVASDGPGGPLSYLIDRPQWPKWRLALKGQGPLTGWNGLASLTLLDLETNAFESGGEGVAEASASGSSDLSADSSTPVAVPVAAPSYRPDPRQIASASFVLSGPTGTFREDVVKNRRLSMSLLLTAGSEAPLPIPEAVKNSLGSRFVLAADATVNGQELDGQLSARGEKVVLAVDDFTLDFSGEEKAAASKGRLTLDGAVLTALASNREGKRGQLEPLADEAVSAREGTDDEAVTSELSDGESDPDGENDLKVSSSDAKTENGPARNSPGTAEPNEKKTAGRSDSADSTNSTNSTESSASAESTASTESTMSTGQVGAAGEQSSPAAAQNQIQVGAADAVAPADQAAPAVGSPLAPTPLPFPQLFLTSSEAKSKTASLALNYDISMSFAPGQISVSALTLVGDGLNLALKGERVKTEETGRLEEISTVRPDAADAAIFAETADLTDSVGSADSAGSAGSAGDSDFLGEGRKSVDFQLTLAEDSVWTEVLRNLLQSRNGPGAVAAAGKLRQAENGLIDLTLDVNLGELAFFAEQLSGQAKASVKVVGPLQNLQTEVSAASPALTVPSQKLVQVETLYQGRILHLPESFGLTGNLSLTTGTSLGEPLNLSTQVRLDLVRPGSKPPRASLGTSQPTAAPPAEPSATSSTEPPATSSTEPSVKQNNLGSAVGLAAGTRENPEESPEKAQSDASGVASSGNSGTDLVVSDFELTVGQNGEQLRLSSPSLSMIFRSGQPPKFIGDLNVQLNDYAPARALTGLDVSGSPAHLVAALRGEPDEGNAAEIKLDLPEIKLGQALHLRGATLELSAKSLFAEPEFNLAVNLGQSQAGPIALSGGKIAALGDGGTGIMAATLKAANGSELLDMEASFDLRRQKAQISSLSLNLPELPGGLKLLRPAALDFSAGLSLSETVLALGRGGTIDLSASLSPLHAKARISDLPFSVLEAAVPGLPQGKADLVAEYAGGNGHFDLKAQLATPAALEGLPRTLEVTANGRIEQARSVQGQVAIAQSRGRQISLDYRLPLVPSGDFFLPDLHGPISAGLVWKGPVAPLWGLLGQADRTLSGQLDLSANVEGTLSNIKPKVRMYLANGVYEDLVLGLTLSGINLELRDQEDGSLRLVAEAGDGLGGRAALEGTVKPLASPPSLALRGQIRRLAPLTRDDISAVITGLMTLEGPFTAMTMEANAVVEQAEINLDRLRGGSSVRTLELAETVAPVRYGPLMRLKLDLPRQIFIRGKGLDSEWGGKLEITNPRGRVQMGGRLKPVRGTFDLLSKQFVFTGGEIRFNNTPNVNPILAVELTRQVNALTAIVRVSGTAKRPRINFESQPPYPSDEVLAQVLFGKKVSQLSRVEALQLANSLRVLAGVGGDLELTVVSALRDVLGLSVLRVGDASSSNSNRYLSGNNFRDNLDLDDGDDDEGNGATSIEAGRYIGDNIYVGVEQNLSDNTTGVRVEVELAPNITLQSRTSTSSSQVGLGWKRDY
jgi:autotransporter translocation and assembly factor TamB